MELNTDKCPACNGPMDSPYRVAFILRGQGGKLGWFYCRSLEDANCVGKYRMNDGASHIQKKTNTGAWRTIKNLY